MSGTDSYPTPAPEPVGLNADWYGYLARGELRFQCCDDCGRWRHPPRVLCPGCGSDRWTWTASSGRGVVFSWTVTHKPLHPAFAEVVPYSILVVEMEEGVRIVCSAREIANEDLALDLPVRIGIASVNEEIGLPYAAPA